MYPVKATSICLNNVYMKYHSILLIWGRCLADISKLINTTFHLSKQADVEHIFYWENLRQSSAATPKQNFRLRRA